MRNWSPLRWLIKISCNVKREQICYYWFGLFAKFKWNLEDGNFISTIKYFYSYCLKFLTWVGMRIQIKFPRLQRSISFYTHKKNIFISTLFYSYCMKYLTYCKINIIFQFRNRQAIITNLFCAKTIGLAKLVGDNLTPTWFENLNKHFSKYQTTWSGILSFEWTSLQKSPINNLNCQYETLPLCIPFLIASTMKGKFKWQNN